MFQKFWNFWKSIFLKNSSGNRFLFSELGVNRWKNYDFRKTWSIWPVLKFGRFSWRDPISRERRSLATNGQRHSIRNVKIRFDSWVVAILDASWANRWQICCFSRFWPFLAKTVLRFSSISHANDVLPPYVFTYLWSLDPGESGPGDCFSIWLNAKKSIFRGGTPIFWVTVSKRRQSGIGSALSQGFEIYTVLGVCGCSFKFHLRKTSNPRFF